MDRPLPPFVQADLAWFEDPASAFVDVAATPPPVMALDPAYAYQWDWWAKKYPTLRSPEMEAEKRGWADWWGLVGRQELDLQVAGCSHAVAHFDFDYPTRAGFAKMAYQDTGHSIFYIGRATALGGRDYWRPDGAGGRFTARLWEAMTADEIGFLVVLGMFLEGFAGELQDAYHAAPIDDPALGRFRATELIEEAEHLQFCLTALRSLIDHPDPAERRSRIRRLVEVEDTIYEPYVRATERGVRRFLIDGLGADDSALEPIGRLPARRRYLYERYLNIEPDLWPGSLRERA